MSGTSQPSGTPSPAAQRSHRRYILAVDAELLVDDQVVPVRTRDLSRGGMCFATHDPLRVGDVLDMRLYVVSEKHKRSEALPVRARVVWCTALAQETNRYQIGASFLALTSEKVSYLDLFLRFLRESAERPAEPGDGELFE